MCWQQMVGIEALSPRQRQGRTRQLAPWQGLLGDKPQWERVAVKDQEPHRRAPSACKVQL